MAFEIGSVIARIDADISGFKKGIGEAESSVQTFSKKIDSFGGTLKNLGQKLALTSAVVGGGLAVFLKDASEEAVNFEKAMITLEIIAGRFGVSGDKAKEAAQSLGKELRIGVGSAAEGLQNLLKSGLSLDQATDLMKRFTNEAITGKSANISLAQAVQNLTFAYATGNSALGNMSGISENFINIIEKGRAALIAEGMAADDVTDEMAKYRGMIDLTNLTMGSAERFHGTLIDKQAEMSQKVTELKVAFGNLINPYLTDLIYWITKGVEWVASLSEEKKKLILIIGFVVAAIGPLLIILGTLVSGISAVISIVTALATAFMFLITNPIALLILAIVALYFAWKNNFMGIQDIVKGAWAFIVDKFNQGVEFLKNVGGQIKEAIVKPFREAWDSVQEFANKIKDKLDFTKRHSPSVVDIVNRGVKEVNRALEGLEGGFNIAPKVAGAGVANSASNSNVNQVRVDLSGAIIADEYSADKIGEIIGDSIIKKLQLNVRF